MDLVGSKGNFLTENINNNIYLFLKTLTEKIIEYKTC